MKTIKLFACAFLALLVLACAKESSTIEKGIVRLSISATAVRASMPGCSSTSTLFEDGDKIKVNGTEYTVQMDKDGKPFVEVAKADTYEACYPAYLCSSSKGGIDLCKLQTAQFAYYNNSSEIEKIGKFNPLWSAPSATPELFFVPVCGILKLTIKGDSSVKIGSIKIENKAGNAVENALSGDFTCKSGVLVPKEEAAVYQNYVVLNCGKGVALSQSGTPFYICMPQGTYSSGLKITICDISSHKSMILDSSTPRTIAAGGILDTPAIEYAPDANLIFSEYFDVFVWGSDYMEGKTTYTTTTTALGDFTKWDAPATTVCNPATTTSNSISFNSQYATKPEYVSNMNGFSTNSGRIKNVYICPGYLACGNNGSRTVLDTTPFGYAGSINVSLDFCRNTADSNKQDGINFQISAGTVSSITINGKTYSSTDSTDGVAISNNKVTLAAGKFADKEWYHASINITSATAASLFTTFQSTSSGSVARYYIDNIVVTSL